MLQDYNHQSIKSCTSVMIQPMKKKKQKHTHSQKVVAILESINHILHIATRFLGFVNLFDKQEQNVA